MTLQKRGTRQTTEDMIRDLKVKRVVTDIRKALGKPDLFLPSPMSRADRQTMHGVGPPPPEPEQLQMFMTPREIHAKYQPLDADREEGDEGYPSSGSPRSSLSTGAQNYRYGSDTGGAYEATPGGTKWRTPVESDEDLWSRKLYEAYGEKEVRRKTRVGTSWYGSDTNIPNTRPSAGTESLGESIEKHGIEAPISLGQREGSQDKPQIVGGHHRLAVQTELDPDQPVPVLHFEDIWHAKQDQYHRYT